MDFLSSQRRFCTWFLNSLDATTGAFDFGTTAPDAQKPTSDNPRLHFNGGPKVWCATENLGIVVVSCSSCQARPRWRFGSAPDIPMKSTLCDPATGSNLLRQATYQRPESYQHSRSGGSSHTRN